MRVNPSSATAPAAASVAPAPPPLPLAPLGRSDGPALAHAPTSPATALYSPSSRGRAGCNTREPQRRPPRRRAVTAAWHRPSPHRLACRAAAVTWTVSLRYPLRTRPAPSPCVHVGPVFSPTREQNSRRSHFCLVTVEVGHRTPAGRHSDLRRQLRLTAPTPLNACNVCPT